MLRACPEQNGTVVSIITFMQTEVSNWNATLIQNQLFLILYSSSSENMAWLPLAFMWLLSVDSLISSF